MPNSIPYTSGCAARDLDTRPLTDKLVMRRAVNLHSGETGANEWNFLKNSEIAGQFLVDWLIN